jgi:hypothetical protein
MSLCTKENRTEKQLSLLFYFFQSQKVNKTLLTSFEKPILNQVDHLCYFTDSRKPSKKVLPLVVELFGLCLQIIRYPQESECV